jgi:spermidine synthase
MEFKENSESDAQTIYRLNKTVWSGTTTKGVQVTIGDSPEYGRMLFMDGELQSASADERIYHETLIHPAMRLAVAQHHTHYTAAELRVLVVGGGEGATVREVMRWPHVGQVDWVDWDMEAVMLCQTHMGWLNKQTWLDPRLSVYWEDIRTVLPILEGQYDCIVLDLPDPDGETGWLYSDDFWATMKSRLSPTGVLVTHCGPVRPWGNIGEGYSRVSAALEYQGVFYHTLIPSFQGEWGFYLWSPQGGAAQWRRCLQSPQTPMPADLSVADHEQIVQWFRPTLLWRNAVATVYLL